jgi:anthranilate synthase/aminodeoxychorismate synthase-like glutamine amidotransferase
LFILVVDNYDSFTYNLVQYLGELGARIQVTRNDKLDTDRIRSLHPDRIVLSPGPGRPEQAGVCIPIIEELSADYPVLGVCLGHQAIGAAFGGRVILAPELVHGKTSSIFHDGKTLFRGLPNPMTAARYHSLIVDLEGLPDCLEVSARSSDGSIMALRHRQLRVEGVQFHPESILTPDGRRLLENFLQS